MHIGVMQPVCDFGPKRTILRWENGFLFLKLCRLRDNNDSDTSDGDSCC